MRPRTELKEQVVEIKSIKIRVVSNSQSDKAQGYHNKRYLRIAYLQDDVHNPSESLNFGEYKGAFEI
jgi:hypothetical protein